MVTDYPAPEQKEALLALWQEVFGVHGGFWELFLDTAFSPERCRCITVDGTLASSLCWLDTRCGTGRFAYLYAVVTHPAFRGQGLFHRLMADTHVLLREKGYDGVLLVPAEESLRRLYGALGYRNATFVSEFSCAAGERAVQLRSVTKEEYAVLRRKLLPACGVIQEEENLDFLAAQAHLFAGEDFLLAAWRENAKLYGMELLGSAAAAPGILKALGCTRGEFRTPGQEKPFSMFLPLKNGVPTPAYFGFAFD